MEEDEPLTVDPLFLAVTRPAMMMGVPIEAGVSIIMVAVVILIVVGSPIYAGIVGAVLYGLARLVVRHDVNAFRLFFLWGQTKVRNSGSSKHWAGSSYTPLPLNKERGKALSKHVSR